MGGVQGWSTGQRGGNPNCPADLGGRPRLRGNIGATSGVRHGLRRPVETTSSLAPIWMVKYWATQCRTVYGPSYSGAKGGTWLSQWTKHMGGVQEGSWKLQGVDLCSSSVVPCGKVFGSAQSCFVL